MKNRNTVDDFMDAFWILYQKKGIEKISVRELCELAGYNRTTFYVYFKDIYDLLEQFIDALILPDASVIKASDLLSNLESIQNIMYSFFQKNNEYLEAVLRNHHNYVLQEVMINRIRLVLGDNLSEAFEYIVRYQISAVLGVLEFWFQQGNEQISDQQLVSLVYEISTKGVLPTLVNTCQK